MSYQYQIGGLNFIGALPDLYPPSAVTVLAFRNRYTKAEKAAIEFAALDNPAATLDARLLAASIRADLADTSVATHIDLQRDDTRGGVEALEWFGLLAVGRAAEILDAPIQDVERPVVR